MTDPSPTEDQMVQLLAKVQANNPPIDFMTDELKQALDTMVSIAFEGIWPEDDERYVTERAAAGFVLGFAAGRDYEQGLAFTARFGLDEG